MPAEHSTTGVHPISGDKVDENVVDLMLDHVGVWKADHGYAGEGET